VTSEALSGYRMVILHVVAERDVLLLGRNVQQTPEAHRGRAATLYGYLSSVDPLVTTPNARPMEFSLSHSSGDLLTRAY
jgi:hypothetical protein